MRLSTRLTLAMVALVMVTAATVGLFTYRNVEAFALPRALARIDSHNRLLAVELAGSVRSARADVTGFRSAAVEGIVQASVGGGVHPDGTPIQQWRDRLATRLSAELGAKPNYLQFRIIGIADGGREIFRIQRMQAGGPLHVVPEAELQQKGDQEYFRRTIALPAGAVHVSPVELNVERGAIETPHMPVVRTSTPIHAPDGSAFGIVIITVDLRMAFDRIRSAGRPGTLIYVTNERGDYLVQPDRSKEFGFQLGKSFRLQDDYPEVADLLSAPEVEPRVIADRAGSKFGVAVANVHLAEGPRTTLVEAVPYASMIAALAAVRDSSLLGGLVAVVGAIAVAIIIARSMTRPLVQMTAAVDGFTRNQTGEVPVKAGGEVGVLAEAFARMAHDVRDKTSALTREIEERRRILDTALDAFIQMAEDGTIVEWNKQAEVIFQWSREEALGKPLDALIVPDQFRQQHRDGLARFLESGESAILGQRFEIDAVRRDGHELKVEVSITAVQRRSGYVFNAFIRDLTEKLAAELQLRQSQKMDAVGQLTGGVAHDFNNILTVITGTIEILAEGVEDRPQLAAIARMIDQAANRGADLTRQLLAFARKQPLRPREIDVNALVVDAAKLLRPTLGEHIEIVSTLEEDAWPAMVDPSQLSTALVNLAVNARDAMPNGGKLTIETGNVVLDEGYVSANPDVRAGPYVMIAVSDTGVGIPAAIRDKVFDPFFTTKEVGKGTGLGLSMVYGFVKQSEGHVKIYSEEGHGTTIKLYLPRIGVKEGQIVEAAPLAPAIGGSETILIVEDDALVREYVVAQLQSLGYVTLSAGKAEEALRLIDQGAQFNLLFTDVIMPGGMNGRQLADEVARRRGAIKVLFTSGYTESAVVHHGRLDPDVALLNKPYRKTDLARKIREVLGPEIRQSA